MQRTQISVHVTEVKTGNGPLDDEVWTVAEVVRRSLVATVSTSNPAKFCKRQTCGVWCVRDAQKFALSNRERCWRPWTFTYFRRFNSRPKLVVNGSNRYGKRMAAFWTFDSIGCRCVPVHGLSCFHFESRFVGDRHFDDLRRAVTAFTARNVRLIRR